MGYKARRVNANEAASLVRGTRRVKLRPEGIEGCLTHDLATRFQLHGVGFEELEATWLDDPEGSTIRATRRARQLGDLDSRRAGLE